MNEQAYRTALGWADQATEVAGKVRASVETYREAATYVASALEDFAEGIREGAAKKRSESVWEDTTDKPGGPAGKSSADVFSRLYDEYRKTQHGRADSDAMKTVTDLVNDLFNRRRSE